MLIQTYLAELDRLRRFSGANSEQIIREAFKDLLKGYARAQHPCNIFENATRA